MSVGSALGMAASEKTSCYQLGSHNFSTTDPVHGVFLMTIGVE